MPRVAYEMIGNQISFLPMEYYLYINTQTNRHVYQSIYINEVKMPWISDTNSLKDRNMESTCWTPTDTLFCTSIETLETASPVSHTTTYIHILCCTIANLNGNDDDEKPKQTNSSNCDQIAISNCIVS